MLQKIAMNVECIYQFTFHCHALKKPIYENTFFLNLISRQFKGDNYQ